MARRLFGTDGIRGVANSELTCETAYRLGLALVIKTGAERVLIGTDTRRSKDMLQSALAAGILAAGADAVSAGVVPTPAVAYLTVKCKFDCAVMISASHNPAKYNGLKVFGPTGMKLPDEMEEQIEKMILGEEEMPAPSSENIGSFKTDLSLLDKYVYHVSSKLSYHQRKLKVLFDCANGSASVCAERIFSSCGIDADFIFASPDGNNINSKCGSTHIEELSEKVVSEGYDVAFAFDGDADRCLCLDEKGELCDGDKIICLIARHLANSGRLKNSAAVVTVLSNMGVEESLSKIGATAVRTAVGDRYVLEEMVRGGYCLGGEQSGHVILSDYATTGDGELTAAIVLNVLARSELPPSQQFSVMRKFPQVSANIYADAAKKAMFDSSKEVADAIAEAETELAGMGRIIVRKSGTEPLVRIMLEGNDSGLITEILARVKKKIEKAIGE